MDITSIYILIIITIFLGITIYLIPLLKNRWNFNDAQTEVLFDSIEQMAKIAENISKVYLSPEQQDVITEITKSAQMAVKYAEQLYKSSRIEKDQRKDEAVKFVNMALRDANIEVTPEREEFIEAVIESAVFLLPKTHTNELKVEA